MNRQKATTVAGKRQKGKKVLDKDFEADDPTIYFDLFKQLKDQFYKEKGEGTAPRSTLEALKDSLGGSVLKDVTFFYTKLNKKSTETVVKTLKEFYIFLQAKDASFFTSLMASYSIIHEKLLTTEFERDVFMNLLKIDQLIISKNRDAIRSNFKVFYPAWYLVQHDVLDDVRRMAIQNLEMLFPDKEKHATAFIVSYENFLALVQSWFTQPAKQFKDINLYLDDDDCERVHSRLLGLAVRAIDHSLALVEGHEDKEDYYSRLKSMLKFGDPGNVLIEVFNRYKKDFSLRSELAHLYLTLIKHGVEDFSNKQSALVVKNFQLHADAKEPLLQQVFWEKELMLAMKPAMSDKIDQFELPKLYKRIQTILEVGGMGIGIKYFENLNKYLLQSPLLDFKQFSSSKKFTGQFMDTFKQVEGIVKAYLSCLDLDIAKFYMAQLVQTYFSFASEVLLKIVLPTRSLINSGQLYADKDMTEALKKNIESVFEKFVDLIVLYPLELYLEKNTPEHMSDLTVGINNYKFIPRYYAQFLAELVKPEHTETLKHNQDLLERSFSKFAASVPGLSKDKKRFESFLVLIDTLAKEKIETTSTEGKSVVGIIENLFENSSKFLEQFAKDNFDIDTVEQNYSRESFANFSKYLGNILASHSSLNKQICEQVVPGVIKRLIDTLEAALGDSFDLFESETTRLEIIQQLFQVFYQVIEWKQRHSKFDIKEVDRIFAKVAEHAKEIQTVDESLVLTKKADLATVIIALTPHIKLSTMEEHFKLKSGDLKETLAAWTETNATYNKVKFDILTVSTQFQKVIGLLVERFMSGRALNSMLLNDIASRFIGFISDDTFVKLFNSALDRSNTKDDYLRHKLLLLDERYPLLSEENSQEISWKLLNYLQSSRIFTTDTTIAKLEKYLGAIDKPMKNRLVLEWTKQLLTKSDKSVELVTLLNFYLKKFFEEGEIETRTAQEMVHVLTQRENFEDSLHQVYIWVLVRTVLGNCQKEVNLKEHFGQTLSGSDGRFVQYCMLAAPSCLQIVLNYDLKRFLVELGANSIAPNIHELLVKDQRDFLGFVEGALSLAIDKDVQFVYGLKKVLLDLTADEGTEDTDKQAVFEKVISDLSSRVKLVKDTRLSSVIEITTNVLSYFSRSFFKLPFVTGYKEKLRGELLSILNLKGQDEEGNVPENSKIDYSKTDPTTLVFKFSLYLTLCKGQKGNKIAEFKQLAFDICSKQDSFPGIKREVSLALLFRMLNIAVEDGELSKLTEQITLIEDYYKEGLGLSSFGEQKNLLLVALLEFLRKVITVIEMFSKEFEKSIHNQIIQVAISKVKELQGLNLKSSENFSVYGCGFDELLVEIAETLARFCISGASNVSENDLYLLLNCGVPVVQKSALIVLSDYYTNRIAPTTTTDEEDDSDYRKKFVPELLKVIESRASTSEEAHGQKQIKKKQIKQTSEILGIKIINEGLDLSLFSYVLTWLELMQRIKSPRLEASPEQRFYEYILNTHPELYYGFLNQVFQWVLDLKIPGKEFEKRIEKINMAEMPEYWTDYISQQTVLELLLHAFFKFSSNFPKFLRNWIQNGDKKYTNLANVVVRAKVSGLILDYEIEQIQNKEPGRLQITPSLEK